MINILLCSDDREKLVAFYKIVGVELVKEKHGSSPEHFAFTATSSLEIYPPRQPEAANFVLRFGVGDVDTTVAQLKQHFSYNDMVVKEPETISAGRKAVLRDPDGRIVELFQPIKSYGLG